MKQDKKPAPMYLLAGGRGSRREGGDPLLARIIGSYGVVRPTVAYIGAASDDNRPFFQAMAQHLRQCGAGEVTLAPLASARHGVERARAILEAADAVYVGGGDVEAGMEVLRERGVIPLLRSLYQRGRPFLGVSAGSIMLAREWVRWPDPEDAASAETFPCLGFAPIFCDTHGEGDAWEELRALLQLEPEGTVGYGIPTGAALGVHPDGRLEALGAAVHRYVHNGAVTRCLDLATA